MTTYAADSTSVTFFVGTNFTSGSPNDTYITRRGFTRYTTSSLNSLRVKKSRLTFNISAVTGGSQTHALLVDNSAGWGTTLDATQADFESTTTPTGDVNTISSTAKYSWRVPKQLLNYTGQTWFKLKKNDESEQGTKTIRVSSQNNATPANRPILTVVYKPAKLIKVSNHKGRRWQI